MTTNRAIMRGAGRRVIGLALLTMLFSLSIAIIDSRPSHAESLLNRTRCILTHWVWQCKPTEAAPVTNPTQTPQQKQAPAQDQTAPQAPTSNGQATTPEQQRYESQLMQPIEFNEELQKPLPKKIAWRSDSPSVATNSDVRANVFSIAGGTPSVAVLSATAPPLEPSEQGWVIMGMAWYWWAGIGAVIAFIILFIRHLILKRKLNAVAEIQ